MARTLFAGFLGVLGGFLGAFLSGTIWIKLCAFLFTGPVVHQLLYGFCILASIIIGPFACFGYWLFRGLKNRKFAYIMTHACTFLGTASASFFYWKPWDGAWCLLFGIFAFCLSGGFGQVRLLRYTDPAWYADPRRAAVIRAGGLMYNYRPKEIPLPAEQLPPAFSIGGQLKAKGQILRTTPSLRKSRTFLVDDIAGVILGPTNGSNVLYDRNGQVLAKFAWSLKNADLLAQLLDEHGVPFYTFEEYENSLGAVARPDNFKEKDLML
ncbi:MAG: hypothetical protein HFF84_13665 [Oscillibacter sp.]|nr:hypothetical protein [Oscillibacter sp.]